MPPQVKKTVALRMRSDAGPGRITASDGYTGWSRCFIDFSPRINDARSLTRTLPGGSSSHGFHDRQLLLAGLHLLKHDHGPTALAHGLGTIIMLMASLWGLLPI